MRVWAVSVLAALVGVALAVVLVLAGRRRRQEEARRLEEQAIVTRVREKAEEAVASQLEADERLLSDSGILSVIEMMEALVSGGNFAEAEKWALNAIHNHPSDLEVPLKLAEVYYRGGQKSAFVALVGKLSARTGSLPPERWRAVLKMGRELVPDHPLFTGSSAIHPPR
jgi:pilus assembly protein FimV